MMLAQIAMLKALNHGKPAPTPQRKAANREVAAFAGHSPKNASGLPNIKEKQRGLRPGQWLEPGIAYPCRHSRHE